MGINNEGTEFYDVIKTHYGSKESFQNYDGGLLNFDEKTMKDIVGAEKLTYPEYIDIQIQTGKDYRGSFMLCYYYNSIEFKGEVETFGKGTVCFKRIYVDGMYPDGTMFEGKEDHVWMALDGFDKLKKGDCISFYAEAYRYIKTSNGKKLEFGLCKPNGVQKIEKYQLPTDDELLEQSINQLICESCYLYDSCDRINCTRERRELRELRKSMKHILKNKR